MAIAVIGMLDEREPAIKMLKEEIEKRRHKTILINISIGTGGIVPSLEAQVTEDDVARAGGSTAEEIRKMILKERDKATSIMSSGLIKKVLELHRAGELNGAVAIGGMTTTIISLEALKALPFGTPKLLISSGAALPAYAGKFAEYFGTADITVMHSVIDTVGLNSLVERLVINGANAICGMVEGFKPVEKRGRVTIALTEFVFCDKGAQHIRELLEQRNFDIVSFHATGLGDKAAENLVKQGLFDAFIDLVPAGLSEYLLGGNRAAGPDRLEGACESGIPYILAPCGFDMISCGPLERREKGDTLWVSRKLAERKLFIQDALRVQARTNEDEVRLIAQIVAEKLRKHKRKELVRFLIPLKGFSSISIEGGPLYDPQVDKAFVEELKKCMDPDIKIVEVDTHINTPEFAGAVVEALNDCLKAKGLEAQ
jgi:uncharacterized protein (UPF0261 family)